MEVLVNYLFQFLEAGMQDDAPAKNGQQAVAVLRIYCICGQKMKVSETMLGLPGKCVACRQKIRIPRADELPLETDANGQRAVGVIYLKDHPEFLRKVKRRSEIAANREIGDPGEEKAPAGEIAKIESAAEPAHSKNRVQNHSEDLCD